MPKASKSSQYQFKPKKHPMPNNEQPRQARQEDVDAVQTTPNRKRPRPQVDEVIINQPEAKRSNVAAVYDRVQMSREIELAITRNNIEKYKEKLSMGQRMQQMLAAEMEMAGANLTQEMRKMNGLKQIMFRDGMLPSPE